MSDELVVLSEPGGDFDPQDTGVVEYPAGGCGGCLGPHFTDEELMCFDAQDAVSPDCAAPRDQRIRINKAAWAFAKERDVKTVLLPCSQPGHPEKCPHEFLAFYERAHVFHTCDGCQGTPVGAVFVCRHRCVANNFYSLCETCYTSDAGGAHKCVSDELSFETHTKPMTRAGVRDLLERYRN